MKEETFADVLNIYGNDTVSVGEEDKDFRVNEAERFVVKKPEDIYQLMYQSIAASKFQSLLGEVVGIVSLREGTDMERILSALILGNAAEHASRWFGKPVFEKVRQQVKVEQPYDGMAGAVLSRVFNIENVALDPGTVAWLEEHRWRLRRSRFTDNPLDLVELAFDLSKAESRRAEVREMPAESKERWGGSGTTSPDMADLNESVGTADHAVRILTLPQIPIELEVELEEVTSEMIISLQKKLTRSGPSVTHRAWQMSHGNTKVFEQQIRSGQDLFVLVDLSGSMQCWCGCMPLKSRGYIAFQVVGAITKAYPRTKVYGFCSDEHMNYIVPLNGGHMPACRFAAGAERLPPGNLDCAALTYMEEQCVLEHATAVVISDGEPLGPAPANSLHLRSHTKELARQFHERGMKFISVLIRTESSIYPSEIEVYLDEVTAPEIAKVLYKIYELGAY